MEEDILDLDYASDEGGVPIELITKSKFTFFAIVTFGLYLLWWMYKSWRFFKDKDGLDIMPAMRAIFSIFFLYQLFERIIDYAKSEGYARNYSSGGLFVLFVILNLVSRLPDPLWLMSIFTFIPMLPPFNALNFAIYTDQTYQATVSTGFSTGEIIMSLIGGVFWLLILIGTFAPV